MTIWTDHEYFNWAVSGRASKADKSHQDLSAPCVEISINIQRCFTTIGWFEKCHIIDKTFCINQLNGHTLSVSGYLNTNVLVTKISSKAVSIDHLTGCCKKCVNMGVAIPCVTFYQNLLWRRHSGWHRTLVPYKQCIQFSSSSSPVHPMIKGWIHPKNRARVGSGGDLDTMEICLSQSIWGIKVHKPGPKSQDLL